jgi:hypothetical protein
LPLEQSRNRQGGRLPGLRRTERDQRVTVLGAEHAAAVAAERQAPAAGIDLCAVATS